MCVIVQEDINGTISGVLMDMNVDINAIFMVYNQQWRVL